MTKEEFYTKWQPNGFYAHNPVEFMTDLEYVIKTEQSLQAAVSGSLPLSEMKEAFQAGKYLGFGEAHRRPGNYHSFEEWLKVRGGNDR